MSIETFVEISVRQHLLAKLLIWADDVRHELAVLGAPGLPVSASQPEAAPAIGADDLTVVLDTLAFYADHTAYPDQKKGQASPILRDRGERARETLARISGEANGDGGDDD